MKPRSSTSKESIYHQVVSSAIQLDFKHGHLNWSMTQLSRVSKVPRTLIYYYFGKSKPEILIEAVRLLGGEIAGSNPEKMKYWENGNIAHAIQASRDLIRDIPGIVEFYHAHHHRIGPIGEEIRKIEKWHYQKIEKFFPKLSRPEVEGVFALFMGLAYTPDISTAGVESGVQTVIKGLV